MDPVSLTRSKARCNDKLPDLIQVVGVFVVVAAAAAAATSSFLSLAYCACLTGVCVFLGFV